MSFPKVVIKYEIPPPLPSIPPTSGGGDGGAGGGGEVPVPIIPVVSTASEGLAPIIPAGSGSAPHSFLRDDAAWQRISYADLANAPLGLPPLPHAASHISGADPLPPPTLSSPGLVPPLPTDPTLVFGGGGAWIPILKTEGLPPPLNDPSQYLRSDGLYAPLIQLAPGRAGVVSGAPGDASQVLLGNAKWGAVPGGTGGGGGGGTVSWDQVTGKPSTFPPSVHAPSHTTGTDLIPLTTVSAPGLTPALPNTGAATKWLRGDASFNPIPLSTTSAPGFLIALSGNATDYVGGDNAFHNLANGVRTQVGNASVTGSGLLAQTSGAGTDYVGGDNACHALPTPATGLLPTGAVIDFAGSSAPAGWLLCDGKPYSTTGPYAGLFAVIQYTYGGSGGTFNVPDLRGRVSVGAGSGAYTGASVRVLGATGGEELHVMAAAEMASHTHGVAHTHTMASHTHTLGNHSHTMGNHTHYYDHYHNVNSSGYHAHGLGGHTHGFSADQWSGTTNAWGSSPGSARQVVGYTTGGPSGGSDGANFAATNTVYASQMGNGWGTSGGPSTNTSDGPSTNTSDGPNTNTTDGASIANTAATGGGSGFNVMQPYCALNRIIKT